MYKQINSSTEEKLSKYIMDFRKAHGTQYSLITMLEKWKNVLDKVEYVCCLFIDFSKAFDTINHDLLLVKLKAYGFSDKSLALRIQWGLSACFTKIKIHLKTLSLLWCHIYHLKAYKILCLTGYFVFKKR